MILMLLLSVVPKPQSPSISRFGKVTFVRRRLPRFLIEHIPLPVVTQKTVVKVSKVCNYRKGELL